MNTFYKINLKPGDCPYCHKGPVILFEKDITAIVLDIDGNPIQTIGNINETVGYCNTCGHELGPYKRNVFKFTRCSDSESNQEVIKPAKNNYFGYTGSDRVEIIYDKD